MKDVADRLGLVRATCTTTSRASRSCSTTAISRACDQPARLEEVERSRPRPGERLRALLVRHIRGITEESYGAVFLTDLESLTPAQRADTSPCATVSSMASATLIEAGIARRRIQAAGSATSRGSPFSARSTGFRSGIGPTGELRRKRSLNSSPISSSVHSTHEPGPAPAGGRSLPRTLEDADRCALSILLRPDRRRASHPLRRRVCEEDPLRQAARARTAPGPRSRRSARRPRRDRASRASSSWSRAAAFCGRRS